ncbi:hypothetical protein FOA52_010334 [Chlamydomonas sp. UWO 241]|nr:hypothetical protein FOA52_010334 [Chlamydomonas sp. UWO 241]
MRPARRPGARGPASSSSPPGPRSLWDKVVAWFVGDGDVKSKLASLGFAAMLSYSVVSNVTYGAALTFSWIGFVKAKGVSPIAEGQWPAFLAFYAGAWMVQNFARPMRFGMAMAMTPWYDNLLANMAATLRVSKRFAFGIALSVMAFGMPVFLGSAIYLLGGLPDGLGPLPPLKRF